MWWEDKWLADITGENQSKITFRLGLRLCKSCHCINVICLLDAMSEQWRPLSSGLITLGFILWLTDMCPPQTSCVQGNSTASNRCRHPKCTRVTARDHVKTAHAHSALCTHLTWNKVDDTILSKPVPRQKSHREPHFSTHWWDRLTVQHTEREVWVWQPATIISSCHYLPSHSQLCSQRQMHKHCMQANMGKHTHKHKHMCNTHTNTQ